MDSQKKKKSTLNDANSFRSLHHWLQSRIPLFQKRKSDLNQKSHLWDKIRNVSTLKKLWSRQATIGKWFVTVPSIHTTDLENLSQHLSTPKQKRKHGKTVQLFWSPKISSWPLRIIFSISSKKITIKWSWNQTRLTFFLSRSSLMSPWWMEFRRK